jgi:16S rRNA (guanine(966)-N(2))-methyltransferase RsmD
VPKKSITNTLHGRGPGVEEFDESDCGKVSQPDTEELARFGDTGSVGIEALSRGATSVHFAESSGHAARVLRQNLAALGVEADDVAERDAAEALRLWDKAGVQFDVCFLDPPYRLHGAYGEILRTIARGTVLLDGGIVVAEHDKRFDPGEGEGNLKRYRLLKQGESTLSFYRRSAEEDARVQASPSVNPQ